MVFIKESHLLSLQIEVISEENKSSIGFFIKVLDHPQLLRIILWNIKPYQFADLVIYNTVRFIDFPGVDAVKLQIDFPSYHKVRRMQSYPV